MDAHSALPTIHRLRVDTSGRVVLPADLRLRREIAPGDELLLTEEEQGCRLLTLSQAVREAQELFARCVPAGVSLADELIRDRRAEAERE